MKTLFLALLGCLAVVTALGADRPARGQMKGMELYSWSEDGKWIFVLLDGTNRLKSEQEVKQSPKRSETTTALESRFMELAKGETVVWNFHFVPGFSFPDKETFAEVTSAAKRAEITLIPDKNEKR
jgi:hypothetical protein